MHNDGHGVGKTREGGLQGGDGPSGTGACRGVPAGSRQQTTECQGLHAAGPAWPPYPPLVQVTQAQGHLFPGISPWTSPFWGGEGLTREKVRAQEPHRHGRRPGPLGTRGRPCQGSQELPGPQASGEDGHFPLLLSAHLGATVTTLRATGRSHRLPRGGGRKESRAGACMQRLTHKREHPVDERGPECSAAVRVPPTSLPGHRAQPSSPSLGLWGNHGFCQQVSVGGGLQEPRVGVLREGAFSQLLLGPCWHCWAPASPRAPPRVPHWKQPSQTCPNQVRQVQGHLGSEPVGPLTLRR